MTTLKSCAILDGTMKDQPLNTYLLLVSYLMPVEGTIVVAALTKEEASNKVLELFKNRTNVEIADVVDLGAPEVVPTEEPEATNVILFDPNARKSDPNNKKKE